MSPARDERRQAVLGCLATHGDVTWHNRGDDLAFADAVLDLAERMRRRDDEVVPMRPARVATEEERQRHLSQIKAAIKGGAA